MKNWAGLSEPSGSAGSGRGEIYFGCAGRGASGMAQTLEMFGSR